MKLDGSGHDLSYCHGIYLEGLRKTTRKLVRIADLRTKI
jgi:hypothetical protein